METLRAELARAKEQARSSNAAALKAAEELRAEQDAHCESKERMDKMAVELKGAADHYQLLEEENRMKATDLEKALVAAKEARSKIRATKEELHQAADIVSGTSCCRLNSEIRSMLLLTDYGLLWTPTWIWLQVLLMRPSTSRIRKVPKWKSCSGHSFMLQFIRCC